MAIPYARAGHWIEQHMADDDPAYAVDRRPAELQTHPLTMLAWIATGLYAMLVAFFLVAGIAAKTSVESATMFGMAVVSGIPLAIMLAIMCTASGRRSVTGRSICIVLGAVSLLALVLLVTS
jgi:peptidoglycan/LPS O-acetylase OafA/YrhL